MKKYAYLKITLLSIIFVIGCADLDEEPYSVLSPENFYRNAEDAESAVMGVYSTLQCCGGGSLYGQTLPIYVGGLADDQMGGNGQWRVPGQFTFDASYEGVANVWAQSYSSINTANSAIDNLPRVDMDNDELNSLIGEARFVRALNYFNLVRLFGEVPLQIEENTDLSNALKGRSTKTEIYDQIISDLEFAETNITQMNKGRATVGAATALLAKVYLTMAGVEGPNAGDNEYYTLARDKALEVMNLGYSLEPNYKNLFSVDNEGNGEIIFELEYARNIDGQGSRIPQLRGGAILNRSVVFDINQGGVPFAGAGFRNRGWGIIRGSNKWCDETDPDDFRREVCAFCEYELTDGTTKTYEGDVLGAPIVKWTDPSANGSDGHENNAILLRYADILLIYAEAENELNPLSGAAYEALEQVRARARAADGIDVTGMPSDLTGTLTSQDEFRQAIIDERYIELAYENAERWFDLKRHGLVPVETVEANLVPVTYFTGMEYLPIPATELLLNENLLPQNTGW